MIKLFLSEYSMIIVLLVLCAGFSIATLDEQYPTGTAAAQEVRDAVIADFPRECRVLIVARSSTEDTAFADGLASLLKKKNLTVVAIVKGEPFDARKTIEGLAGKGTKIDVIACSHASSNWGVIRGLATNFPSFRNKQIVKPAGYYWPNFLKISNLLNIAGQIAVIAIIAIGMTMVIITGGIDLSVGSLIALSAVVAAWLIWMAGGTQRFIPVIDVTAVIWIGAIGAVALLAGLASLQRRGSDYARATATVSIGALVLLLLYAGAPFAVAVLIAVLQMLGPTPLVMLICCLLAISLCACVGFFSGSMVTFFRVPPFIVTLGMMLLARGLAEKISRHESIDQIPESFVCLGRESIGTLFERWGILLPFDMNSRFNFPNAVLLMLALYAVAWVVMSRMSLGRYIYAVGGNAEAARLSGVPVKRVLLFVYTVSGALAGLGGVIMASQLKCGDPNYGGMYELYVIAAAVVGGTSLSGGQGKILSTLIGAFIIAVNENGMNLIGMDIADRRIVLGLVILAAVLFDMVKRNASASGVA